MHNNDLNNVMSTVPMEEHNGDIHVLVRSQDALQGEILKYLRKVVTIHGRNDLDQTHNLAVENIEALHEQGYLNDILTKYQVEQAELAKQYYLLNMHE